MWYNLDMQVENERPLPDALLPFLVLMWDDFEWAIHIIGQVMN